jgi:hypothetical protein
MDGGGFSILEVKALTPTLIEGMADGSLLAVRVPGWCPEEVCRHALRALAKFPGVGYADEPTFKKVVGGALYDAARDPEILRTYLESAPQWLGETRKSFHPYGNPADRLRQELQERWSHGCDLERIGGRPCFAGLIRALEDEAEARPHQDMTHWDIPACADVQSLHTQLSCVIYFAVAEAGGGLELWSKGFESRSEYEAHQTPGDYGLDRSRIGPSAALLAPRSGDLIAFNARHVHAVRKVVKGLRCTQSLFIGYRGRNRALSTFS